MLPRAVTIGRIAAIPVRLHWSWLLIFGLLVVALRPAYAASACPGAAPCGADLGLAALMALLIGASVLLHELGHALVARRLTVPVQSITLFAFGGVAEVDAEAPGPGAELVIAVAGPAVSLLLALGAGLLWWLRAPGNPGDLTALLAAHLALANAIMALFNLLPGYPMDGGRVLRATLWFLNDELLPATRVAAQVGRACGGLIALAGLAVAVAARLPLVALWSAVVGLFLYRTASASYRQLVIQTVLRDVTVGDLMQRRLRTVTADLTLEQFVARFVLGQSETGFAVVEPAAEEHDAPELLGMMTLRNLRRCTTDQWSSRRVAETMTPAAEVMALSPRMLAFDALYTFGASPDDLLPVLDGRRLVGILRRRDIAVFVQVQLARRKLYC
ncbi:MAG: site-2 protease family protein [Chloroflexi bacterium OHK40]